MRIILLYFCLFLAVDGAWVGANEMSKKQELKITFDQDFYKETKNFRIFGTLSTFVNCGSQYATWRQFPQAMQYRLVNLDSGETHTSVNMMLSISESGNEIFDHYGKQPCDQVVSKDFSISLNEVYFNESSKSAISNFELQAEYAGHTSNTLTFTKTPLSIKTF
jgi:hypothetical protein